MVGYSHRSLAEKLGLKDGMTVLALAPPPDYRDLLGGAFLLSTTVTEGGAEFVHLFARSLAEFDTLLPKARRAISPNGVIWVSWYKQAAKIPTDLTENRIRERALLGDLVDVKVCAVSEIWSGLKLVVRRSLRA